jgi:DNA mismatch repair protein MutS
MLRSWLERPLLSPVPIQRRLHAVQDLVQHNVEREELRTALRSIGDMERLIGKAVYGTANGRDLLALANSIAVLPALLAQLQPMNSTELRQIARLDLLTDVGQRIRESICDDPPFSIREGGILRTGYNEELDHLRDVRDNGARLVAELESRERERTGAKKLKVGYNKVFGYYIDVPNSAGMKEIPPDYIRKQTLVSSERYFTPELKDLENTLLTARERIVDLEYRYFEEVRREIAAQVERVKDTASCVARLDVYASLAEVAVRSHYTMPAVDNSREIRIQEGRHPVVEKTQKDVLFVPNDTVLNDGEDRLAIITGPNMAGKSTYMRQTALIVLMAQIGSFVPAKAATIGVVDRIFTRIGASDDLASGQSTFMVEMNEMADILKNATPASLLILDEIGRGTSTYDGMAIARAVLEYCADRKKLGAKTMFATHYHELSGLEGKIPGVKNYNITAKKQKDTLVFLRKIVRGAADDSYGIEVAKLAGLPDTVIRKAKQFLTELEEGKRTPAPKRQAASAPEHAPAQIDLRDLAAQEIYDRLRQTDVNTLTPLEALNLLYELQKKVNA